MVIYYLFLTSVIFYFFLPLFFEKLEFFHSLTIAEDSVNVCHKDCKEQRDLHWSETSEHASRMCKSVENSLMHRQRDKWEMYRYQKIWDCLQKNG